MKKCLEVLSYFSVPVDFAEEFRDWKEFVGGSNYDVRFENPDTSEIVSTRYEEREAEALVVIESNTPGGLMHRVSGAVINLLSARSDYVIVYAR